MTLRGWRLAVFILILSASLPPLAVSQQTVVVSLRDFTNREIEAQGLTLSKEARLHITASGGGEDDAMFEWEENEPMFAFAWIIDSNTREPVWEMTMGNTDRKGGERVFEGDVTLSKGSYELYYVAYAYYYHGTFDHIHMNVDRRKSGFDTIKRGSRKGFWSFFSHWFDKDIEKEFLKRALRWGVDIAVASGDVQSVQKFTPPKLSDHILVQMTGLGENEARRQAFTLSRTIPIHVTALGEATGRDEFFDYGWIINTETRRRVWEMTWYKARPAGGAQKNVKVDETITLSPGTYELDYVTDDSHSLADWNAKPPYDPLNWGIILRATDASDVQAFTLVAPVTMANVIVEITRVGDSETRSAGFTLKKDATVRVYALGEGYRSHEDLADYGWILNAKTREKVWQMRGEITEHAGGATKNRLADEIIKLPKGSYLAYYTTDDSHSYEDWNASPPYDPEHWGITVTGWGKDFDPGQVTTFDADVEEGVVARIVKVRDDEHFSRRFTIDKPTRVRAYGLGEGRSGEMFDYGWIENARNGEIIWEMTYNKTSQAGGARKNRMVNSVIMLDRGDYILNYQTDDSHSYQDWNDDPPADPDHWGITLYREGER